MSGQQRALLFNWPQAGWEPKSALRSIVKPRDEGVGLKFPNVGRAATQLAKFLWFSKPARAKFL
jgi:hypothetical protein